MSRLESIKKRIYPEKNLVDSRHQLKDMLFAKHLPKIGLIFFLEIELNVKGHATHNYYFLPRHATATLLPRLKIDVIAVLYFPQKLSQVLTQPSAWPW